MSTDENILIEIFLTCSTKQLRFTNDIYSKRKSSRVKLRELSVLTISSSVYKRELKNDLAEDRDSFAVRLSRALLSVDRPDASEANQSAELQDARQLHQANARWRIDGSTFIDLICQHR
jgi:hypothetical protein